MATARELLKGKVFWLVSPGSIAATPIGAGIVYYCMHTLSLPEGSTVPLLTLVLMVAVVLAPWVNTNYVTVLRTLNAIAKGKADASVANLQEVARELQRIGDRVFRNILIAWIVGVAGVALGLKFWMGERMAWFFTGRLILSGLMFSPIGALMACVLVMLRARTLTGQLLTVGLTPEQLVEAVPTTRQNVRKRFLLFAAILVATPSVMSADIAVSLVQQSIERVRQAPADAQSVIADQAIRDTVVAVLLLGGLVFVVALFTVYFGGTLIASPLRALAYGASRLAEGDLRGGAIVPAEDELWAVSAAFSRMQSHLTTILSNVRGAGMTLSSSTEQLKLMANKNTAGANDQAASVHQTSATTEELARVASLIAQNAGEVAHAAEKTLEAAQNGQKGSTAFIASMEKMKQDNRAVSESVVALNQRVAQIGRIVEFINGVADKADLLALNAELEGTKAGEVGRGFSLVAGEMRRLAENVMRSTREIEQRIEEIREATRVAVQASSAGMQATELGAHVAVEMSKSLERIVGLAQGTSRSASAINIATQQQQSSSSELAESMATVLRVTRENVATTQNMSSSSSELATLAGELRTMVERFTVD